MVDLPNARLVVDERKVTDYLLSESHPVGRFKAAFFRRYGFTTANWGLLRDALVDHARFGAVLSKTETEFGIKYTIDGLLITPDGGRPGLRTIWFVAANEGVARLVTAYPIQRDER